MEEFSLKTIGEYRARYPQLRELTDYQLTRAVYDTTAPDMPLEDFAKAFGGVTEEDPEEVRIQEYNLSHPDDTIRREDHGERRAFSPTRGMASPQASTSLRQSLSGLRRRWASSLRVGPRTIS